MSIKSIEKSKHLLLTGLLVSVGLWATPGSAQVKDNQLNAFVEALRIAAPPQTKNDGMYSSWQVLPGIIPDWTKRCTGTSLTPEQFDSNADAARRTVSCIARRELNNQMKATGNNETAAVRGAACWWMTGNYNGCSSGATATYVQNVLKAYQQQSASAPKR
ncbi:MAG TPA: hypothetical protein V6C85_32255 [Allocoleopsis sp.]